MNQDLVPSRRLPDGFQILEVRAKRVVLDADLAALLGVETKILNQAVKRNIARFPEGWAFQLSEVEVAILKSQSVTSSAGWGGRRKPPTAFTEHGVVMAASVLKSERAVAVMKFVVEVFVEERRRGRIDTKGLVLAKQAGGLVAGGGVSTKLQAMIVRMTDAIAGHEGGVALRHEAQEMLSQSIKYLKEQLNRPGLENQKLAAEAAKYLAEAEVGKAVSRKTHAEAAETELRTLANRLLLVIKAELAINAGELDEFMAVLKDLGRA